jgi:hypothetical protein
MNLFLGLEEMVVVLRRRRWRTGGGRLCSCNIEGKFVNAFMREAYMAQLKLQALTHLWFTKREGEGKWHLYFYKGK